MQVRHRITAERQHLLVIECIAMPQVVPLAQLRPRYPCKIERSSLETRVSQERYRDPPLRRLKPVHRSLLVELRIELDVDCIDLEVALSREPGVENSQSSLTEVAETTDEVLV